MIARAVQGPGDRKAHILLAVRTGYQYVRRAGTGMSFSMTNGTGW
ncbi:MAG: hypothetical protein NVSMB22_26070 [Chloroflexota bacterium]